MIGFLPISIVSAGMSLLRTGAGALSAFFGSSDKQFTSTYASTLTASRGMRRRPLNSYLKLSRIVERNPSKPRHRSTSFHSQEPFSNRPQHNRRPQGRSQRTMCSIHAKITNHSHPRIQSTRNQREKKISDRKNYSSHLSNRYDAPKFVHQPADC